MLIPINEAAQKIRYKFDNKRDDGETRRRHVSPSTLRRWAKDGLITSNYSLLQKKQTDVLRIDWVEAYRLLGSNSAAIKPGRRMVFVDSEAYKKHRRAMTIKELVGLEVVAQSTIYAAIAQPVGSVSRLQSIDNGAGILIDSAVFLSWLQLAGHVQTKAHAKALRGSIKAIVAARRRG
jgi:phage repressor protein C with HTH and peptisase S24 domain